MSLTSTSAQNRNGSAGGDSPQQRDHRHNLTQQLIAENVKFLIEQLKQGQSEALNTYLGAMARFHHYSFGNILQIARYRPTATHVAGMHAWNQLHRYVRRGEKGIPIFAPMIARKRREEDQETKPAPVLVGFRRVYVWERRLADRR